MSGASATLIQNSSRHTSCLHNCLCMMSTKIRPKAISTTLSLRQLPDASFISRSAFRHFAKRGLLPHGCDLRRDAQVLKPRDPQMLAVRLERARVFKEPLHHEQWPQPPARTPVPMKEPTRLLLHRCTALPPTPLCCNALTVAPLGPVRLLFLPRRFLLLLKGGLGRDSLCIRKLLPVLLQSQAAQHH